MPNAALNRRFVVPAFATPVMHRVTPRPGVERITHGTLRFFGWERPFAVIARERMALGAYVVFTADFIAAGTSPTHHLSRLLALDRYLVRILEHEN